MKTYILKIKDLETGKEQWINTSSPKVRQAHNKWWYERQQQTTEIMHSCRVDMASVATDEDYVKALMGLFQKRGVR